MARAYEVELAHALPYRRRARLARLASEWPLPGARQHAEKARNVWGKMCLLSVNRTWDLGSVYLSNGGVPALSDMLGVERVTISRYIKRWDEANLVRLYYGERKKRYPPLEEIEIPFLSFTLAWLGQRTAEYKYGEPWAIPDRMAMEVAEACVVDREIPLDDLVTKADAVRWLRARKT